jgi:hypothetical protein
VVEIHECVRGPQPAPKLIPGYQVGRSFQQRSQDEERLMLQTQPNSALPELTQLQVQFEYPEPD